MMAKFFGRNKSERRAYVRIRAGEISFAEFKRLRMVVQSLHDSTDLEVLGTPPGDGGAYIYLENGKYILEARTEDDPRKVLLKFSLREMDADEFFIWLIDSLRIEVTNKAKGTSFKIAPPEYTSYV